MVCLPVVARFNASAGSGFSTFLGSIFTAAVCPLIGMRSGGLGLLFMGMFSIGFGMGFADVSANSQAVIAEKLAGSPQMGFFHAVYAIGSFLGALIGGAFAEANVSVFNNIFIVSAVSMLLSLFFYIPLFTLHEEREAFKTENRKQKKYEKRGEKSRFGFNKSLIFICIIGFIAYMAEGSVEDWAVVYFTESLNASPIMCSIGFATFSLAIAAGRFLSDNLVQRFGTVRLLQLSGIVSSLGLVAAVFAPYSPYPILTATVSLGVSGAGLSISSPIVSSSAGRVPGMVPAEAISIVTSFAYSGYFIGPPLFGGLAELLGSLQWSLLVDALLILVIAGTFICSGFSLLTFLSCNNVPCSRQNPQ